MGLDPADATTLAFLSFILAFKAIKDNVSLTKVNWISGNDLKGKTLESVLPSIITSGRT